MTTSVSTTNQHPAVGLLAGKVAFVTGASRGIGASAAQLFAREGASVLLAARSEAELRDGVEEIRAQGGQAEYVLLDLSDGDSIRSAVHRAVESWGRLDVAFNNGAAIQSPGPIDQTPEETFDHLYQVNLKSVWVAMVAEYHAMRETVGSGAIVNNSSVGALMANPELPAYGAMKRGVNSITASAAVTWATQGVRVNAIAPANTATAMIETWEKDSPGLSERLVAASPMGRTADPREMAEAAAWLLSDRASYVTGEILRVDGGTRA